MLQYHNVVDSLVLLVGKSGENAFSFLLLIPFRLQRAQLEVTHLTTKTTSLTQQVIVPSTEIIAPESDIGSTSDCQLVASIVPRFILRKEGRDKRNAQ